MKDTLMADPVLRRSDAAVLQAGTIATVEQMLRQRMLQGGAVAGTRGRRRISWPVRAEAMAFMTSRAKKPKRSSEKRARARIRRHRRESRTCRGCVRCGAKNGLRKMRPARGRKRNAAKRRRPIKSAGGVIANVQQLSS